MEPQNPSKSMKPKKEPKSNLLKGIMNRFLTKKRAKKAPVPARVEVDLTAALPSQDDFRTSLIMPNLSARFSMLREQDDPNSMLGKASDDSVLTPRRQSRLHDFGFMAGGLADIAEVSSIRSVSRRPQMNGRQESYASEEGYGTDDNSNSGSMMSRARPGEGNVLFGGRQKVYKIPVATTGSDKSLGSSSASSGAMTGKVVYDDDLSLSAFQKHRQEERQRQQALEELERTTLSANPQSDFDRRNTSSSTNSGPSNNHRSSTAATSVNSQTANSATPSSPVLPTSTKPAQMPIDRSNTKARRLYEQGLNRDMQDQQSSAMNRLNSINKNPRMDRAMSPPMLSRNRSPSSGPEFPHRALRSFRAASPPPSGALPTPTSLEPIRDDPTPSPRFGTLPHSPPQSPLASDTEEIGPLNSAIRHGDRGKATAMGAFNRPKQFSEEQYLERQKQIRETRETGRESPMFRRDMSPATGAERQKPIQETREPGRESPMFRRDLSGGAGPERSKPLQEVRETGRESPMIRRDFSAPPGPERQKHIPEPREVGCESPMLRRDVSVGAQVERQKQILEARETGRESPMFRRDISAPGGPDRQKPIQESHAPGRESPMFRRDMSTTAGPFSKKNAGNMKAGESSYMRSRSGTVDSQSKFSFDQARPAPLNLQPKFRAQQPTPPPEEPREKPQEQPQEQPQEWSAFSIFQKAANQMKTAPDEKPEEPPQPPSPPTARTFFSSPAGSDTEDEPEPVKPAFTSPEVPARLNNIIPRAAPPVSEHPALRSQPPLDFELDPPPFSKFLKNEGSRPSSRARASIQEEADNLDSPTLRDRDSGALGGMVQHLRTSSNVSSVYSVQPSTPKLPLAVQTGNVSGVTNDSRAGTPTHSSYSPSNPWDLEDLDRAYFGEADSSGVSPIEMPKSKAGGKALNGLDAQRGYMQSSLQTVEPTWEQELKTKHTRDASTATAHEREAFANELEQRKRAIQENLRSKVASTMLDSDKDRGPSQLPGINKVFGTLRSKTSRDSMNKAVDPSTKAMKMLGITVNPNASTSALPSIKDGKPYGFDYTKSESNLEKMESRPSRPGTRQAIHEAEEESHFKNQSPPMSSKTSARNRSSSEVSSGRSRSRPPGRYRDDLEKAMMEGTSSRAHSMFPVDEPPTIPELEQTIPDLPSFAPSGMRNGPAPGSPGYFNQGSPHLQASGSPSLGSSRPSPGFSSTMSNGMPSPALSGRLGSASPALNPSRPSPMAAPYSAHSTPPVSNSTTPVAPSFESTFRQTTTSRPRKRSILKSNISEPKLLSTTNNIDTVALPAGASLANGMNELDPPPLPPINPRRRRFGFGRTAGDATPPDSARTSPPGTSYADGGVGMAYSADEHERGTQSVSRLRKVTSEGWGLNGHGRIGQGQRANGHPPAMPVFGGKRGPSPPRVVNGMF
ncbi:hypothetical protein P152DRAFT_512142 [Eremomyces bilateralis CBS 781.70]|uniref:Uncharacterized protein n=1 Tax=Eremomyces bilateralis CBS 781.70 TaxID=1392243 RepID=A0A6G1G9M4_9PEZI|nr:uncharacterized protein P152DRAFT_512142 [Eremomyces bilateralis CBS 781.70]KAF1814785.1 hypothetical protein P152DRAFT_512142 [Eremomyces bilateralis CBS 781.70]